MRTVRPLVVLLSLLLVGMFLPAVSAHAAVPQQGTYFPVTSTRFLDTRNGNGAPVGKLGAGQTLHLSVGGRGPVPASGVSAVVATLTVVSGTSVSFLSAFPYGQTRPSASSINFVPNVTRANTVTVPLGTDGKIDIYNSAGTVSVVLDVVGYYWKNATAPTAGNEFTTVDPERLIDTRQDPDGALQGRDSLILFVDFGANGSLSKSVAAVALNITATGAVGSGFLSVFDGSKTVPTTSTLNYSNPGSIANTAIVKTKLCKSTAPAGEPTCADPSPVQFGVYNASNDPVHVIVDLVGVYFNDGSIGLRFSPLTSPKRISDSRIPLNGTRLTPNQTQTLTAPSSVAGVDTVALVSNVTAIRPTASTYMTIWENGQATPAVSNLNAPTGSTVANGAVIALSTANKFNLYNNKGNSDFAIDIAGRFDQGSASAATPGLRTAKVHDFSTTTTHSERRSNR